MFACESIGLPHRFVRQRRLQVFDELAVFCFKSYFQIRQRKKADPYTKWSNSCRRENFPARRNNNRQIFLLQTHFSEKVDGVNFASVAFYIVDEHLAAGRALRRIQNLRGIRRYERGKSAHYRAIF